MSYSHRISPEAESDMLKAQVWYDAEQPGLGERFARSIEETVAAISERPFSFPEHHVLNRLRRAVTGRFP